MSCEACKKKDGAYFKNLGQRTGNPYGRFTEGEDTRYIPVADFKKAQEAGLYQGIEIEVL